MRAAPNPPHFRSAPANFSCVTCSLDDQCAEDLLCTGERCAQCDPSNNRGCDANGFQLICDGDQFLCRGCSGDAEGDGGECVNGACVECDPVDNGCDSGQNSARPSAASIVNAPPVRQTPNASSWASAATSASMAVVSSATRRTTAGVPTRLPPCAETMTIAAVAATTMASVMAHSSAWAGAAKGATPPIPSRVMQRLNLRPHDSGVPGLRQQCRMR